MAVYITVSAKHGHTNIKLSFSLYIPVVLVPYLLACNKRSILVMRLEVFIDAYIVQENLRCLSRKKLVISIPRTHRHHCYTTFSVLHVISRSQWPRGLRRRSTAARLLGLLVRIPPGAWMFVCCQCFVLSGRGLCDELITRPEKCVI